MSDDEFWQAVYLMALYRGHGTEVARVMADEAVKGLNEAFGWVVPAYPHRYKPQYRPHSSQHSDEVTLHTSGRIKRSHAYTAHPHESQG